MNEVRSAGRWLMLEGDTIGSFSTPPTYASLAVTWASRNSLVSRLLAFGTTGDGGTPSTCSL